MSSLLTTTHFEDEGGLILSMMFEELTVYIKVKEGTTYTPNNVYRDKTKPDVVNGERPFGWKSYRLSNIVLSTIYHEDYIQL